MTAADPYLMGQPLFGSFKLFWMEGGDVTPVIFYLLA